jgi:hypothetical protein
MYQEIDLCQDSSDYNRERPNSTSIPSLPRSSKRLRDKRESHNEAHPRNESESRYKTTATGSAPGFVADLDLTDEVEVVSPQKKRRGVTEIEQRGRNNATGDHTQLLKGKHAAEKEAAVEATSHPLNSDSKQTSQNDGSANKHSKKVSTLKAPSKAWEGHLSELAHYRRIHGHCKIPYKYSENTKLANWVTKQRCQYRLHLEGKASPMTNFRIKELESLGFEWDKHGTAWGYHLNELADYREIHGHCNVPTKYSENTKLGTWVGNQRCQYKLHLEGKASPMTTFRIKELEKLGFEWTIRACVWKERLSELADYRKIYGDCNVPTKYSETTKLGNWVAKQRTQYKLHLVGKTSQMTNLRIQELENLGFKWKSSIARAKRMRKKPNLDDNVTRVRESAVETPEHVQITAQTYDDSSAKDIRNYEDDAAFEPKESVRCNYMLQVKGKESPMAPFRTQALESLGFEWKPIIGRGKGTRKTPSLNEDTRRIHKKAAISRHGANYELDTAPSTVSLRATGYH